MIGTMSFDVRQTRMREQSRELLIIGGSTERIDMALPEVAAEAAEKFAVEIQKIVNDKKKESA